MRLLCFDSETTGIANHTDKTKPSARVVQLAAKLIELNDIPESYPFNIKDHGVFKTLVNTGVEIPKGAYDVHGVDEQMCEDFGMPHEEMCFTMASLIRQSDAFLGQNLNYDIRIMRHAFHLEGFEGEPFEGKPVFDVMKLATPILKIPKKKMHHREDWRWPKLTISYKYFKLWELEQLWNEDMGMSKEEYLAEHDVLIEDEITHAHDAMVDNDMAIEVFLSYCRMTGMTI